METTPSADPPRPPEVDYASMVAAAGDCTTVTDVARRYVYVSPACPRLLGWTESELLGSPADDFVHPDDLLVFQQSRAALAPSEHLTTSYRLRCRDGSSRWVEETSEIVGDGESALVVSTIRDITERQAQIAALEHRAASDPLTGVANRTVLLDRLQHGLRRLDRGESGLAVMYLDLDRFKVVNDSLGHHVGDGVLLQMAERLMHHLRPSDTLARLGGDEFVIVAEGVPNEPAAMAMANRVVTAGHQLFEVDDQRFACTVSVGIAFTQDPTRAAEDLLHEADLALYRAKARGRDRAEVFDEDLRTAAVGRMATERLIRRAIEEDRLVVEYQPIIDLLSERVVGAEALVRIRDEESGLLLPRAFLDVAEETGLLVAIDELVLADAVKQAAGWRARLAGVGIETVGINVTARHLADAQFPDAVLKHLDANGLAPGDLQVEVTERVLMEASNSAMTGLRSLREAGVKVGLDDFGTGLSSLAYLRRFPLDFIKVDRTFIVDLERSVTDRAILAAVTGVARALGLVVIAEGVENEDQRKILERLGCERAQGFFLAPPSDPRAIDDLVRARQPT
jgi:diguanylate cyclase (GGDEF)-like protein/PAS domain S-box-containing protein